MFSAGDGSTTFNIPDLTDRGTMGAGANGALGTYKNSATAVNGLKIKSSSININSAMLVESGNYYGIGSMTPSSTTLGRITSQAHSSSVGGRNFSISGTHDLSLSSTNSETWAKHARVNYIIKF